MLITGRMTRGMAHPYSYILERTSRRARKEGIKEPELQCVSSMGDSRGPETISENWQQILTSSLPVALKCSPGTLVHQSCFYLPPGASRSKSRFFLIGEDSAETTGLFFLKSVSSTLAPKAQGSSTSSLSSPSQSAVPRTRHGVPTQRIFHLLDSEHHASIMAQDFTDFR